MRFPALPDLLHLLHTARVRHVVLSPGSRSAPISLALGSDPRFDLHVVPDERSAGFVALGIAHSARKPAALVCTSGSAVANYLPAILEAHYRAVPLVVLSADRPAHLIDIGDGQTIRQPHLFGSYATYLPFHAEVSNKQHRQTQLNELARLLNRSLHRSMPIHVNLPLSEPLYGPVAPAGSALQPTFLPEPEPKDTWTSEELSILTDAPQLVVVCGQMHPAMSAQVEPYIAALAKLEGVSVAADLLSNLPGYQSPNQMARQLDAKQSVALISLGSFVVAKGLRTHFRQNPPLAHFHLGKLPYSPDTYHALTRHIEGAESDLLAALCETLSIRAQRKTGTTAHAGNTAELTTQPLTDAAVFQLLALEVPPQAHVHWGNSSPIRYAELFSWPAGVSHFCNRGTSGIDGSLSTAVGHALANPHTPVWCILGDLSFLYDHNALWMSRAVANLRIVVINNSGGQIFNLIDNQAPAEIRSRYFVANHQFTAQGICTTYRTGYFAAHSAADTLEAIVHLKQTDRCSLLEIFTDAEASTADWQRLRT